MSETKVMPGIGLRKNDAGEVEVVEGGRYVLSEDSGDIARMSDDQLKKMRKTFAGKKAERAKAQAALPPDQKYSSPESSSMQDDQWYYSRLLSQIEAEMCDRMLTLD